MPAYIYGNVDVTDPALYEEYRREVANYRRAMELELGFFAANV